MTRNTGSHPSAHGPARGKSTREALASSITKKPGRAGLAAAVALAASAVLVGIAGSAAATTGQPLTTAPVMASHALTSVPGRAEVTATSAFNSTGVKRLTRDCPAGLRVVGAGYHIEGANGAVGVSALVPTPASAPTAVQLRAVELAPFPGRWRVTVEAVCGDVDTTVSAATTAFNSAGTKNVSTNCGNLRVIGTGYSIREPATRTPVIGDLGMDPGLTTVTAFATEAFPTAARWSLTTLAICSPYLGQTLVPATEPPPLDSASPETVIAVCPAGTQSAGGGFFTGAAGNVVADDLNLTPPQAETVAYEDQPYAPNWTLRTSVICA
jgi:hypothetical protein